MCGISVVCNPSRVPQPDRSANGHANLEVSPESIQKSLELIQHRGPDDIGIYTSPDGRVGLGHVRLSIIDLPGGHQPLSDLTDTVHCVVAGELYDYASIRADMESKGIKFKTHSDSEIVLGLYALYGLDLIHHLRGEFTFALYDASRSLLFVARDRFGIKPLYYTFSEGRLLIANEMKAFLGYGWKPRWDRESIMHSGEYGDDRTLFHNARKLPPGHYLTYDRGDRLKIAPYWDHSYPSQDPASFLVQPSPRTVEEAVEGVRSRLVDAVKTRLRSDVPLAFYLSGGIDSSAVTGIAAKLLKEQDPNAEVHAFTLSFPDRSEVDEGPRARRLAEHVGATMHMIEPTEQELVDELETAMYHCEQPMNQLLGAGKIILSKAVAALGFKVVLSGEGSDEIFAGYNFVIGDFLRQQDILAEHMFKIPLPTDEERAMKLEQLNAGPRQDLLSLCDELPDDPYRSKMLGGLLPPIVSRFTLPLSFFTADMLQQHGPPNVDHTIAESIPPMIRSRLVSGETHALNGALYYTSKSLMTNIILNCCGDRTEMVNSIEGRPPFLDHRLAEYANSLPPSLKIRPVLNPNPETPADKWTYTEKWVLREAVRPFVTEEIYATKKSQYNVSIPKTTSSLKTTLTPLQAHLKKRITKEAIEKLDIFRWDAIEKSLRGFLENPFSPEDGGLDKNGRRMLYVLTFVVLQEKFGIGWD